MQRQTCRKKFRNGVQKKVLESAGLAGRSRPRLASPSHVLAQTRFSSRAQNIKNGPKWIQNRRFGLKIGPRESYDHFGPVRTGPGPKTFKSMPKNRQVAAAKVETSNTQVIRILLNVPRSRSRSVAMTTVSSLFPQLQHAYKRLSSDKYGCRADCKRVKAHMGMYCRA